MDQLLEEAFDLLCQISVKDLDVDRMARAKSILKAVYAQLISDRRDEGSDG